MHWIRLTWEAIWPVLMLWVLVRLEMVSLSVRRLRREVSELLERAHALLRLED